jgi:hypothetical protein
MPPIHELTIVGTFDVGVPNLERIILRPMETLNLAAFALVLSYETDSSSIAPLPNHFLWLGDRWVHPPSWIVVYTGPGGFRETVHVDTGAPILEYHWGLHSVALSSPRIAVSLFKLSAHVSHTPVRRDDWRPRLGPPKSG